MYHLNPIWKILNNSRNFKEKKKITVWQKNLEENNHFEKKFEVLSIKESGLK